MPHLGVIIYRTMCCVCVGFIVYDGIGFLNTKIRFTYTSFFFLPSGFTFFFQLWSTCVCFCTFTHGYSPVQTHPFEHWWSVLVMQLRPKSPRGTSATIRVKRPSNLKTSRPQTFSQCCEFKGSAILFNIKGYKSHIQRIGSTKLAHITLSGTLVYHIF